MKNSDKTKGQLGKELAELRRRIAELEAAESERKRAEETPALEVEQLTALIQASQAVTASLELDQVLAEIVSLASEAVGSDYTSVVLVDEAGRMGRSAENLPGVPSIKFRIRDDGLTSWIVDSGQAVIIDEIGEDGAMIADLGGGAVCFVNPSVVEAGVRSVAGLPLRGKERLLGVIYLHSLRPSAFHGQLPLLTAFANQAAVAVENARLYQAEQRRRQELEALQEISLAVTAQLELDELLENIVEQGCRLLEVEAGAVYLVDEMRGDLNLIVSHGYTRDYTGTRLAPGEGVSGKVLQSSEPLAVDGYHHWEGRSPTWEAEPLTGVLGVPLKRGEQVIGVLDFGEMARARGFDEHDVWLSTLFAAQATIAIENARLYRAEQAARERADTLRKVSRAVGSTLELDDVLSLVLRQAKRVLTYDTASILLFAGGEPTMAAVSGYEDEELVKTEVTLRLSDSPILQAMARDHRPVVIADVREDERWIWIPGAEEIRAWVGVPLLVRDEMIGVLMIDSAQPGSYTAADCAIAQALANQAAGAIENARLFEAEQRRRQELEALQEISLAVTAQLELDELLENIVEQGCRLLNVKAGGIYLVDETKGDLEFIVSHGYTRDYTGVRLSPGEGVSGKVLQSGEPLAVDDYHHWAGQSPTWEAEPLTGCLGVPLKRGEQVTGVLGFDETVQARSFDERDVWLATLFAAQAAIAIENARLYEQAQQEIKERKRAQEALQQHNRELAMLNRAGRALVSTLDLDQLLVTVLEEVRHLMDVIACSVWLIEQETDELVCLQAIGPKNELVRGWRLAPGQGICGWVARHGESLIVPDVWADGRYFKGVDEQTGLGLRSSITMPLRVKEDVIGVLQVWATEADRFSTADRELLEPLAASAAIAIENARLYEQARQDAETKSTLLREVNHRVKNNLTAIVGLLHAERSHAKSEDRAIYQPIMQNLINRVQGLATVHSLLSASEWTPLSLSELTAQVIRSTMQTLPRDKRVDVNVAPSPARVTPDQAHNLALVINELTTNTIKHGLQERDMAHIGVRIEPDEDTVQFEFRDDGPGYPDEVLQLEHSGVGFDLIRNLVRKNLGGELSLHNDRGAVAVIRFAAQA